MDSAKKQTFRSIGAVFVGILANFVIAIPIDMVLHAAGVFPPNDEPMADSLFAIASSYRIVAALVGGYLTALLAPSRPMKHAIILGLIGVVMCGAGAVAMWDKGHHWYAFLLIAISVPCSWAGGKLRVSGANKG